MDESQAGFGGFGLRFCGRWGRRGFRGARGVADAEGAADGVQQALQGGGQSEEFGDSGFGEEGFEVEADEGGLVFEVGEEPAVGGGEFRAGFGGALAVAARVGAGGAAGGEAGHEGGDDAGGALEARDDEGGAGVAEIGARDEGDEGAQDGGQTGGEDGGQGAEGRGRGWVHWPLI